MDNKNDTKVILVDLYDNQVGVMEKMEAHRKALLHRAISVFICNTSGSWLLQRRALDKYHSKGLWTNACCSHPMPGESAMEAAHRRLREELGMKCRLESIFNFTYKEVVDDELTEYEFDHVFLGVSDDLPVIDRSEVMEYKFITYEDLCDDLQSAPEKYTVWFRKIFEEVRLHLNQFQLNVDK